MAAFRPWRGGGDPTTKWRRVSWSVLITYRVLRPVLGRRRAIALLQSLLSRQFRRNIHAYLAERFGISQEAPGEAFDRIATNYKDRGERIFGPEFVYVQVVQDSTRSFTHIKRCFFNDFFRAHGAPELTSIFCTLDAIWIDELHQPQYNVRFERPSTLARGDDACRFEFSRPPAAQQDVGPTRAESRGDGP
jgi:hypothetical protein